MNPMMPPAPAQSGVFARTDSRHGRGRGVVAGVFAVGAMYVAFAVGAPWLLRDAPPDTYTVIATNAACAAQHIAPADCDVRHR